MNEPAFPAPVFHLSSTHEGMSIRDYFAVKAMQGLITRETKFNGDLMMYTRAAYEVADAMMEARKA